MSKTRIRIENVTYNYYILYITVLWLLMCILFLNTGKYVLLMSSYKYIIIACHLKKMTPIITFHKYFNFTKFTRKYFASLQGILLDSDYQFH